MSVPEPSVAGSSARRAGPAWLAPYLFVEVLAATSVADPVRFSPIDRERRTQEALALMAPALGYHLPDQ